MFGPLLLSIKAITQVLSQHCHPPEPLLPYKESLTTTVPLLSIHPQFVCFESFECLGIPSAHVSSTIPTLTHPRPQTAHSPSRSALPFACTSPLRRSSARHTSPTLLPPTTAPLLSFSPMPVLCPNVTGAPTPSLATLRGNADLRRPLHRARLSTHKPSLLVPPPRAPKLQSQIPPDACRRSCQTFRPAPSQTSRISAARHLFPHTFHRAVSTTHITIITTTSMRRYLSSLTVMPTLPLHLHSSRMRTSARSLGVVVRPVARARRGRASLHFRS